MTNEQKIIIIENMINLLDLPDSAYDKARKRYEDLGDWFDREESAIKDNKPHIFPQGSFRLGTAIRPLDETEEYDLDLACKLREGITKGSHTQAYLKKILGQELETYRTARSIKKEIEAKHRCWRLEYQDDLSFHMDIVPCIPANEELRKSISESMYKSGLDKFVSDSATETTVFITDDRHASFKNICNDWNISNPEGYAKWFEYRMNPERTIALLEKAQIDDVPLFKKKTPLQRVIQLLKRHRDNWSKDNPDSKPISIIITTLAARAYQGESELSTAVGTILGGMGSFINPVKPRVPNPVNPKEDFADRWYRIDCLHLRLEDNFNAWLLQAQKDFQHVTSTIDTDIICEHIENKFSLKINKDILEKQLEDKPTTINIITRRTLIIKDPPKPWGSNE